MQKKKKQSPCSARMMLPIHKLKKTPDFTSRLKNTIEITESADISSDNGVVFHDVCWNGLPVD
jgi:hypothetical protein